MHRVIKTIPVIIHFSLLTFFGGLTYMLFHFNRNVFIVAAVISGVGATLYALMLVTAAFVEDCPYKSPVSLALYTLIWRTIRTFRRFPELGLTIWGILQVLWIRATNGPHERVEACQKAITDRRFGLPIPPSIKNREDATVENDKDVGWQSLAWLTEQADFRLTTEALENIIRIAIPAVTTLEMDERTSRYWAPFLAQLAGRYNGGIRADDIPQCNVIAAAITRLLVMSDDLDTKRVLRRFHSDMGGAAADRGRVKLEDNADVHTFKMWFSILSVKLEPNHPSFNNYNLWRPFKDDFFAVPEEAAITVFMAQTKWMAGSPAFHVSETIDYVYTILGNLVAPSDFQQALDEHTAEFDGSRSISFPCLQSIIHLLRGLITREPSKPSATLAETFTEAVSRMPVHPLASDIPTLEEERTSRQLVTRAGLKGSARNDPHINGTDSTASQAAPGRVHCLNALFVNLYL